MRGGVGVKSLTYDFFFNLSVKNVLIKESTRNIFNSKFSDLYLSLKVILIITTFLSCSPLTHWVKKRKPFFLSILVVPPDLADSCLRTGRKYSLVSCLEGGLESFGTISHGT